MLQSLHVKNLALIHEAEVEFHKGLNILTGETGAGKSIIVGSMNLALGEKIPKDMIRNEDQPALVELVFTVDTKEQEEQLKALEVESDQGQVILTRKISGGRSTARINSETVTVSQLKAVAAIFIDIYGQHENQTLLHRKKHLELLDAYGKDALKDAKENMKVLYEEYRQLKHQKEETITDEETRRREMELLSHEIAEIKGANLKVGEDEQLEESYRFMMSAQKVASAVGNSYCYLSDGEENAASFIGRATREFSTVCDVNEEASDIYHQLNQMEDMISQLGRQMSHYLDSLNFSQEEFYEVEQRLNEINRLKDKYGQSIEHIIQELYRKEGQLKKLEDYDQYLAELDRKWELSCQKIEQQCQVLTEIRKKTSAALTFKVTQALIDLNFMNVCFDMKFERAQNIREDGWDEPQFMISLNPGEALKPLENIASGGELSRIMLAMKSVFAANDKIGTLLFDEIDTGISGRTAQMVSEKMNDIGKVTQVISITHLPQIAAMADSHYLIEKEVVDQTTMSVIHELSEEESCLELARMLGGVTITDAVLQNAKEMRKLALNAKK